MMCFIYIHIAVQCMCLSECYRSDVSVHIGGSDDPSRTADTDRTGTRARLSSSVQLTGMY